jgi:hypothetical protein
MHIGSIGWHRITNAEWFCIAATGGCGKYRNRNRIFVWFFVCFFVSSSASCSLFIYLFIQLFIASCSLFIHLFNY